MYYIFRPEKSSLVIKKILFFLSLIEKTQHCTMAERILRIRRNSIYLVRIF